MKLDLNWSFLKNEVLKFLKKGFTEEEINRIEPNLKQLMIDVVVELGCSPNATHLLTDIENLIQFEKDLADVSLKNTI